MGQLAVDSLLNRDYPVVAAVNLVFALFVVAVNIGVDVLYGVLDPRIRYE
jgi:peptide/nickel transport system permease protein